MKNFKQFGGNIIEDTNLYILEYIKVHPEVTIIIGTDSNNSKGKTVFGTVICFVHPGNGIHVIYTKEIMNKIDDIFLRMWTEVTISKTIADEIEIYLHNYKKSFEQDRINNIPNAFKYLTDNNILLYKDDLHKICEIHCDINPNKNYKSNIAYQATNGWLKSEGYIVKMKPNSYAASCAADLICRH